MKRLSIMVMLTALALCVCSCGDSVSKPFKAMQEEVQSIEKQISETTDCDDLQMLNFGILGLRSDLDNLILSSEIPDTEISQLDEMLTNLEATWNGRWAVLDCEQALGTDEFDTSGEEDYEDYDIR